MTKATADQIDYSWDLARNRMNASLLERYGDRIIILNPGVDGETLTRVICRTCGHKMNNRMTTDGKPRG